MTLKFTNLSNEWRIFLVEEYSPYQSQNLQHEYNKWDEFDKVFLFIRYICAIPVGIFESVPTYRFACCVTSPIFDGL